MKNPYLYGYLPFFTVILLSLTFGIYSVTELMSLFQAIGVYDGMREFLTDFQLRVFLLIILALFYFMVFSAFKLIGETVHELAMLFFSKDKEGEAIHVARGGYVIFFVGSLVTVIGMQSFIVLIAILLITVFTYFVYTVYKMSHYMSIVGVVGLIAFELIVWFVLIASIVYVLMILYNGVLASLPFAN
jgi:hypothetical protein